jgi:hypothetical protein
VSTPIKTLVFYGFLALIVSCLSACDTLSLPRLSFEESAKESAEEPPLPYSVTYAFTPELAGYTRSVAGCAMPHTIPVGEIITNTFLKVGQKHFNGVQAEPPVGNAHGVPFDGYRIIVDLKQFQFNPVDRMGEEDRYHVVVDLELDTVYEDATGTPIAQSPLSYHKKVKIWAPVLSGQASSCATTQIDGTVEHAADKLVNDMVRLMPDLAHVSQQDASQEAPDSPAAAAAEPDTEVTTSSTATPSHSGRNASVQFRTKLVDANQNLILEGGETVVLLIETTNVSGSTIPSAYVELRGTPILIEAFKRITPLPVPIGELKAGETRTAEIRGRLGQVKEARNGELIIGIILSEGLPPGTHTIRTEIQPGRASTRKK